MTSGREIDMLSFWSLFRFKVFGVLNFCGLFRYGAGILLVELMTSQIYDPSHCSHCNNCKNMCLLKFTTTESVLWYTLW